MFIVGAGDTSNTVYVKLRDSATGFAKTGLLFNTAGVFCAYVRPKAASVDIALVTQTVTGAWTSGGFVEVDAAKHPGLYRLDLPDGVAAAGVGYAVVSIGFTGVLAESLEIILDPMPDIAQGTVLTDPGNTSATFKTNLTSAVDNFHKDAYCLFRTGALAGQVKKVTAYSGTTKFITVNALTAAPGTNDTFVLVNR